MAKLTLFFNNRPIDVFHLEQSISSLGRDSSNTFIIDSLAIAPTHLKIVLIADEYFIENLSEHFSTLVNNTLINRSIIRQGDKITIGKHTLFYSHTSDFSKLNNTPAENPSANDQVALNSASNLGTANLQIMNGADIGLVLNLNKVVNEINIADTIPAIIVKRNDGYYISRLTDDVDIHVDGAAISDETILNNNTAIQIAEKKYIYFIE